MEWNENYGVADKLFYNKIKAGEIGLCKVTCITYAIVLDVGKWVH